jgi:hypothetical protein
MALSIDAAVATDAYFADAFSSDCRFTDCDIFDERRRKCIKHYHY